MVEIYYNSRQFIHTLCHLIPFFCGPFAFFEKLAGFYKKKGYFENSPSRIYRYQVLLDFITETLPSAVKNRKSGSCIIPQADSGACTELTGFFRELLTFDLYLRENCKSRPDFARDPAPFRETMRNFYSRSEKQQEHSPAGAFKDRREALRMTHLEPFFFPVWEKGPYIPFLKKALEEKQPKYVLFDYQNRDPLTQNAKITIHTLP